MLLKKKSRSSRVSSHNSLITHSADLIYGPRLLGKRFCIECRWNDFHELRQRCCKLWFQSVMKSIRVCVQSLNSWDQLRRWHFAWTHPTWVFPHLCIITLQQNVCITSTLIVFIQRALHLENPKLLIEARWEWSLEYWTKAKSSAVRNAPPLFPLLNIAALSFSPSDKN